MEKEILVNTEEGPVCVHIVRKRIRSMILRVNSSQEAVLSVGYMFTEGDVRSFLEKKANWLGKHAAHVKEKEQMFAVGTPIMYWFGTPLPVYYVIRKKEECIVEKDRIVFCLKVLDRKTMEKLWHKLAVATILAEAERQRAQWDEQIADAYGKKRPNIAVRTMRTRWGVCTPAKSSIRLSTRLVHLEPKCLSYVLLHEYVHLLVPNHGPLFYEYVSRFMPDWKEWNDKLR